MNEAILVAASDHPSGDIPRVLPNKSAEPNAAVDEKKSKREPTASATAKSLLCGMRDSTDALGPLKSATGALRGVDPSSTTSLDDFRSGDGLTIRQLLHALRERIVSMVSVDFSPTQLHRLTPSQPAQMSRFDSRGGTWPSFLRFSCFTPPPGSSIRGIDRRHARQYEMSRELFPRYGSGTARDTLYDRFLSHPGGPFFRLPGLPPLALGPNFIFISVDPDLLPSGVSNSYQS